MWAGGSTASFTCNFCFIWPWSSLSCGWIEKLQRTEHRRLFIIAYGLSYTRLKFFFLYMCVYICYAFSPIHSVQCAHNRIANKYRASQIVITTTPAAAAAATTTMHLNILCVKNRLYSCSCWLSSANTFEIVFPGRLLNNISSRFSRIFSQQFFRLHCVCVRVGRTFVLLNCCFGHLVSSNEELISRAIGWMRTWTKSIFKLKLVNRRTKTEKERKWKKENTHTQSH